MNDDAVVFWENVKKEIKLQNTTQEWVAKKASISFNTFQGWISKGICPRVNEAVRIATVLNTSVEYLTGGMIKDNVRPIKAICQETAQIAKCLERIQTMVKNLQ